MIAGATGLVGGFCLKFLCHDPEVDEIFCLSRRFLPNPPKSSRLKQKIVDFNKLNAYSEPISVDQAFLCLGTTRKQAGSKSGLFDVDYTYSYEMAHLSLRNGVKHLFLVSSLGASTRSPVFYSRVKGQLEDAVCKLPFKSVHIFRPSALVGQREVPRLGEMIVEKLSIWFPFVFWGPLKNLKPIEAGLVAKAMVHLAKSPKPGVHIYESSQISKMAQID